MHRSKNRKWLTLIAVAVIVAGGFLYFAMNDGPVLSEEERIRQVFVEGEQAAEQHNIPALMNLVSKDFSAGDIDRDRLRILLMQSFREQAETWVTVDNLSVQAQGDSATASADVTVEARPRGESVSRADTYPVTLTLRKEEGKRFMFFPVERWKVVGAEGTGLGALSDLLTF